MWNSWSGSVCWRERFDWSLWSQFYDERVSCVVHITPKHCNGVRRILDTLKAGNPNSCSLVRSLQRSTDTSVSGMVKVDIFKNSDSKARCGIFLGRTKPR